jgi:hypothetical protein
MRVLLTYHSTTRLFDAQKQKQTCFFDAYSRYSSGHFPGRKVPRSAFTKQARHRSFAKAHSPKRLYRSLQQHVE